MEKYPNRAQVSLSDATLAEVTRLARLDDRSESATIRKLVELALAVIHQQQPAPPMNGAQHHQEARHGVDV